MITGWALASLIVMAVALVAMAAGQVILAISMARVSRQTLEAVRDFQRELRPTIDRLGKVAEDASRVSALAVVQAERVDQLVQSTAHKIESTTTAVHNIVTGPLQQGAAIVAGIRAAVELFRAMSERRQSSKDGDEALFVG